MRRTDITDLPWRAALRDSRSVHFATLTAQGQEPGGIRRYETTNEQFAKFVAETG